MTYSTEKDLIKTFFFFLDAHRNKNRTNGTKLNVNPLNKIVVGK